MFRPPPHSSLFPYTTLFRSGIGGGVVPCGSAQCFTFDFAGEPGEGAGCEAAGRRAGHTVERDGGGCTGRTGGTGDRKSTRLNSSHRCISYAVFCLKKKRLEP